LNMRRFLIVDIKHGTIKAVLEAQPFKNPRFHHSFDPLTDAVIDIIFNRVGVIDYTIRNEPYLFSVSEVMEKFDEILRNEWWKLFLPPEV